MSARIQQAVWERAIKQNGFTQVASELVTGDPFDLLVKRAAQGEAMHQPSARITMTLNNAGDYGAPKVSVSITIPVLCTEADISLAGEAAFIKLHQMVNEASSAVQLPLLP
jgi:hypothetical protein